MWSLQQLEKKVGKQPDLKVEMARRKSQYTQMLEMLKDRREVTNLDLAKISFRYSARIGDMRKNGHKITAIYDKPGVWRYVYRGHVK